MAGTARTVTINVVGNSSGATTAISKVATEAESTSSRMAKAFGNTLNLLNNSGLLGPFGEALNEVGGVLDSLVGKAKSLSGVMMGVGGGLAAAGSVLTTVGAPDTQAHAQLGAALQANGDSISEYSDQIDKTNSQMAGFGHTTADSENALTTLYTATGNMTTSLSDMGLAANLAASQHESLADAAVTLVKVIDGSGTKTLARYGITAESTKAATQALTTATKDAASADTSVASAKQKLADVQAELAGKTSLTTAEQIKLKNAQDAVTAAEAKATSAHQAVAAAQQAVTKAASGSTSQIGQLADKLQGQAAASVSGFSGHLRVLKTDVENAAAEFGQKYGPALSIAGSAMLGIGATMDVGKAAMDLFRGGAEAATVATEGTAAATEALAAAEGMADAAGLPMLATLGLIVLGVAAVSAVAYELYEHWGAVWGGIKDLAADAWKYLEAGWNGMVNGFKDTVSTIASIAENIGKGLANGVIGAINAIINGWDSLHFSIHIPGVGIAGHNLPGTGQTVTFGVPSVPDIPYLADGGIVTSPTLAMIGEAGPEAVVPLSSGGSGFGGTTVVVNVQGALIGSDLRQASADIRNELIRQKRATGTLGLA